MRGGDTTTTKTPTSVVSTTTTRSSFLVASLIIFSYPCSPGNNVVVVAEASFVVGGGKFHPSTVAPRRRRVTPPRPRRQEMTNDDGENDNVDNHAVLDDERRNVLLGISRWWWCCCSSSSLTILGTPFPPAAMAASPSAAEAEARIAKALPRQHRPLHDENIAIRGIHDPRLRDYRHPSLPDWQGTSLPGPLSLSQAHRRLLLTDNGGTLPMAKYPDPILRIPSSPVPRSVFRHRSHWQRLHSLAMALQRTAREEGAVGLAAQQCGIDVRLIFLDKVDGPNGIFLVNPRIVRRSPESKMKAWTEECLVLPPGFTAALLRDAEIVVEYESLGRWDAKDDAPGTTRRIVLSGELARCAQHEMDHDRGVLIVDHVPLEELRWRSHGGGSDVVTFLADIENSDGLHDERMRRAYERYVAEPSSMLGSSGDGAVDSDSDSDSDSDGDDDDDSVNDSESDSDSDSDGDSNNSKNNKNSKSNSDSHTANPTTRKTNKPPFVSSANAMDDDDEALIDPTFRSHPPPAEITATSTATATTTSTTTTSPSNDTCDDACLAERNETIRRRRVMMNQSRSNTLRGEVLELSRQRALLYGTEFRGLSPGYCSGGSANGGGGVCP